MNEETYSVGQLIMCVGRDVDEVLLGCITSIDHDKDKYLVDWEVSGHELMREFSHLRLPMEKRYIQSFRNFYHCYMKYRMNK